jgi:hypothetical protein
MRLKSRFSSEHKKSEVAPQSREPFVPSLTSAREGIEIT